MAERSRPESELADHFLGVLVVTCENAPLWICPRSGDACQSVAPYRLMGKSTVPTIEMGVEVLQP